jgi:cation diffusion facilitator CzcD-associated flavoprotein CzcO
VSARIAIVGSGLAALVAHSTLRAGGVPADEIAIFGESDDPAAAWRARADAIRQTHMRSESDGHPFPRTFPGLAAREAWQALDPWPLLLSVADRYRPSVRVFLDAVDHARDTSGWDTSFVRLRVDQHEVVDHGFLLNGRGPFRHVLLGLGHPGLAQPPELRGDPRAVHAYEPHEFAAKVAVVGAGMAAATEWRNARAVGADVVSVRRREPVRRPLNLPRPLFTKRGLAGFHRVDQHKRVALLRSFATPSYPPGSEWDTPVKVMPSVPDDAEVVVCATGFLHGYRHDPLLARLVEGHDLPTADRWLVLNDDATVPGLTDDTRTLAISGVHAQWAFPAADTLAGMRWVAHRFLRRCRTR